MRSLAVCLSFCASIFLGLFFLGLSMAGAQSISEPKSEQAEKKIDPAEVIDAFVQRLGGAMHLQSCGNVQIEMKGTVSTGAAYEWKVCHNDELISSNIKCGGSYYRVYSDTHGWSHDEGAEWKLLDPATYEAGFFAFPHYLTIHRLNDVADQMQHDGSAQFVHPVTDVRHDTHVLKMNAKHGEARFFYFDKQTSELVKYRYKDSETSEKVYHYRYAEREEADGQLFVVGEFIQFPSGTTWDLELVKLTFEVEFDDKQFECPAEIRQQIIDLADRP